MNPYQELNINQDASEDEIKQSFRDLSKIHHPDKGGDHEKFAQVNNAYMILKDPVKRAYYDKHGSEQPKQDPIFTKSMGLFSQMVADLIDHYDDNIIYYDIIELMDRELKKNLKALRADVDKHNKAIKLANNSIEMFRKRLKFKQEKAKINMFEYVMNTKIDGIKLSLTNLSEQEKILETVLDWVSDFEFQFDKKPTAEQDMSNLMNQYNELINRFNINM